MIHDITKQARIDAVLKLCDDPGEWSAWDPRPHKIRALLTDPETPLERINRIAADPEAASDSDKLRSIADYIDIKDAQEGLTGTDAQDFLRELANFLDVEDVYSE